MPGINYFPITSMYQQIIISRTTSVLLVTTSLVLISKLVQTTQDGASGPHGQLAGMSYFQVQSHAMFFGRDSTTIDAEVRVLERYSNELGRAQLEFQFQEFAKPGSGEENNNQLWYSSSQVKYIFSAKVNKLMRIYKVPTSARPRCELSNRSALAGDLFGLSAGEGEGNASQSAETQRARHISQAPELADWEQLLSAPEMPSQVIGFARLLLFVELHRQDFRPAGRRSLGATVRNTEADQFELTFKVPEQNGSGAQEATMTIYLSKDSAISSGYPFRVWLRLASRAELMVDFTSVEPMRAADLSGELISMFNFPLGCGCSQQLSDNSTRAANFRKASQAVFSFEAQLSELWYLETPARLGHLFVAYDAHAKALRVDSLAGSGKTATASRTTIHDFALGRKYHLSDASGELVDSISPVSLESLRNSASSGRRKCLVARISAKEQAEGMQDAEPILPWSSLIEMGSALVRNIETRVYEMVSERLPKFMFQLVAYLDSLGNEQLTFNFERIAQTANYSIVYFVATTSGASQPDQLIRVDVYKRDVVLYRVNVHNFQWSLTDAPDGQLEEELFSLGDTVACSLPIELAGATTGGALIRPPGRIHLELVYVENAQTFRVLPQEMMELLASAPTRNKALVRSLTGYSSNSLFTSQMRDLKSEIYGLEGVRKGEIPYSSIRLVVDVELAGLPRLEDVAIEAVFIGTALLSGFRKSSSESVTPEQCFWEASSKFSPTGSKETSAVLFSYCSSKCWIDSQATVARGATGRDEPLEFHSGVFIISSLKNTQLPCEVLRIQADKSTLLPFKSGAWIKPWRDVQINLRDKVLNLVFVNEGKQLLLGQSNSTSKHPGLLLKVSKVSVIGSDVSDDKQRVLDGVSLPAEVALETVRMDSPGAFEQAPETCRARCVAHLDCRSYSVCHGQERADCRISTLELDIGELAKQLVNFYQLDKQSPERKSGCISSAQPTTLNAMKKGVEKRWPLLIVSKRCQLGTIIAQDMFESREIEYGPIERTVWQSHLKPVGNLAECARMCLEKNVNFFKQLAKLRSVNSGRQNASAPSSEAGENTIKLRHQLVDAMRFWCHGFYFLDTKLEPLSYQVMSKLRKSWTLDSTASGGIDGLCYLARPKWAPTNYTPPRTKALVKSETSASKAQETMQKAGVEKQKPELVKLPFKGREFLYSLLYKRHYGFRLARVNATGPTSLEITNNQSIESHPPDVEFCARQCFSQAAGHWCRSFDVLTFTGASGGSASFSLSCIYNSLSLQDAPGENSTMFLKQQMTIAQHSPTVSYDHYEPHEAYALDNVAISYLNELDAARQQQQQQHQQQQQQQHPDGHLPPMIGLYFTICVLIGLCTGSALALVLMKHVYHVPRRHVRSPRLSREFICMEG